MKSSSREWKRWAAVAAMTCLAAVAEAAVLPGPVVSPEWVAAHRDAVTILAVHNSASEFSAEPKYTTDPKSGKQTLSEVGGHIPGALLLEFGKTRVERVIDGRKIGGMLPEASQFEATLQAAGVPAGMPIVIVTPGVAPEDLDTAARVYWSIKYYGGTDLAVLDGGLARWLEEGRAVESSAPAGKAGDWKAGAVRASLVADSAEVAKAAHSKVQLIDARPAAFFYGLQKRPAVAAAGHIAGALDFPAELRTRPVGLSQRFLGKEEYIGLFRSLGISASKPVITYCNTGHMASGAWFVMSEIVGNAHAAVYDGSMLEWAAEQRPVVAIP